MNIHSSSRSDGRRSIVVSGADGGEIVPEAWSPDVRKAVVEAMPDEAEGAWREGVEQLMIAFADFLRVEVADGSATDDTRSGYIREVRLWVQWCRSREIDPARVKRSDIARYRDFLKQEGLAPSTRQLKIAIIRRFYDAIEKSGLLLSNPAQGLKGGKDLTPPEEKIRALTGGALAALVAHVPSDTLSGKRDRALIGLMAIHGLRRVEVHRLNHESVGVDGDTGFIDVWGKGNRRRRVYLRPDTYAALMAYMRAKIEAGLPLHALFVAHDNRGRGARISRGGLNFVVDKYLSGTSLKRTGVSCHALRHTHGTLAIAGGAKVEHLRDAMGHSDIATTSLYVRAVGRKKHNPANFIDIEL